MIVEHFAAIKILVVNYFVVSSFYESKAVFNYRISHAPNTIQELSA